MGANTYVAVGNMRDMSNIITNIAPKETPMYTSFGKTEATGTFHEWLEDGLDAPRENAQVEGFLRAVDDPEPRNELGNHCQIMKRGYKVTATQEKVAKYGVKSEMGYQMQKCMKELALDVEWGLINNATNSAGSTATPRRFKGVAGFITTNALAAGGPLTEDLINDAMEACWNVGGHPTRVYLSSKNKRIVSAFDAGGQKWTPSKDRKLVHTIRVYEGDFGQLEFIPHRLMPNDQALVLDREYFKIATLRPFHRGDLPKTHDALMKDIVGELTLEARAEKASAKITGIAA